MSEGIANVEYDVGRVVVEFDYDADLIDEIKSGIPARERSWDEVRRAWVFTPHGWEEARRIIETYLTIVD